VRVGQTHRDVDCFFHKESVASDQRHRESFQSESIVTTSMATLEEIAQGIQEVVKTWELREERVLDGFRHDANIGTTGAFKSVGDENYREIEEWEEMLGVQDEPLERSVEVLMEKHNGTIHSADGVDAKVVDSKQHLQRRCCV
jgi:hypothetical protein